MKSCLILTALLGAATALFLSAGIAGILNATAPIFAALVAWAWLGEKLTLNKATGLLVGTVGVWLLVRDKVGASMEDTTLAVIAALGGSFLYGVGGNFTRRYASKIKPLAVATGSQVGAALVLLPVAILTWPETSISLTAWAAAIVMGLFSTALAYILYFRLIANTGPTNAITVTYLIPLFAMLLGALVIDEPITIASGTSFLELFGSAPGPSGLACAYQVGECRIDL